MSRKRTIRRHWALLNPIQHAIEGCAITPDAALSNLKLRELSSLDAMVHGRGGLQEWSDISAAMNLCETMARGGVGPEALPYCQTVEKDLIAAARRYESTGAMGLTATGIEATRAMLEYHDLQRKSISRGEYERFIQTTANRIRSHAPEVMEIA